MLLLLIIINCFNLNHFLRVGISVQLGDLWLVTSVSRWKSCKGFQARWNSLRNLSVPSNHINHVYMSLITHSCRKINIWSARLWEGGYFSLHQVLQGRPCLRAVCPRAEMMKGGRARTRCCTPTDAPAQNLEPIKASDGSATLDTAPLIG